jgi:hypothetical protein
VLRRIEVAFRGIARTEMNPNFCVWPILFVSCGVSADSDFAVKKSLLQDFFLGGNNK